MNHYCTYFDRGFLLQGIALWISLRRLDPESVLWVLALDDATRQAILQMSDDRLRVVDLVELERDDPALAVAKQNRSKVEYYFTLSPCWPRYLLRNNRDIAGVLYLDADTMVHRSPAPIWESVESSGSSVVITAHRFPAALRRHYERHGRYNVGVLLFCNNAAALSLLDDWRDRCIEWCRDEVQADRYADQKYLDAWPERFGSTVYVLQRPGVNLAPWNWEGHSIALRSEGNVVADGDPLVIFHYARFRPFLSDRLWQSGQLDYGVMPFRLRNAIYGAYWKALKAARDELGAEGILAEFPRRGLRLNRNWIRLLLLRVTFGTDWLRVGNRFYSLGWGLGRYSGRTLGFLRKMRLRK